MHSIDTVPPQENSVFGRMFNVLATPGDVFAEIKERPVNNANWLIPGVTWLITGLISIFILFSQDWAVADIQKAQEKTMEQQGAAGKMSQADADRAIEITKKYMPLILKISGSVTMVIYAFGVPFFWGFVIWLVGVKGLKGDFEYMKAVEAAGLSLIIYILAGAIGVLVAYAMGKLGNISAALFLKEFDFGNRMHFALAAINPFYLWFAAVIATAAAVLAGKSWAKAAGWIFCFWILLRALLIAIKLGQFVM